MKTSLKLFACWAAFAVSIPLYAIVLKIFHIRAAAPPDSTPIAVQLLLMLVGGIVLVLGLWPMASRIAASFAVRAFVLSGFLFLVLGINGTIEARIFTTWLTGAVVGAIVFYLIQAALLGTVLALCFGAAGDPISLPAHTLLPWISRGAAAWLVWPVIYFVFGMAVSPIVVPYYHAGIAGLRIPSLSTVLMVQIFRGLIFLAASLPLIAFWKGTRRGLWLALGLTHAVSVGLYQLVGSTFLPLVLRIFHGAEITCDSFTYAGVLVLLFTVPAVKSSVSDRTEQAAPSGTPAFHSR
jgi:hypothetical protein